MCIDVKLSQEQFVDINETFLKFIEEKTVL